MIESYYKEKAEYSGIGGGRMSGIRELLGDYAGTVILDIGCGQGVLGRALKDGGKAVIVHGVDISPQSTKIAKEVLDQAHCMDIESGEGLSELIKSNRYDTVIISEVLEHLFYPEKILKTIAQNAHPDTKIIITVPNLLYWKSRAKIFLGRFDYGTSGMMDRGHIHFFSWKSLCRMIADEGFRVTGIANNVPDLFLKPFGGLIPGLTAFQFIVRIQR